MRHDVRHVILLRHDINRPPHGGRDILADRVHVLGCRQRLQHFIRWHLEGAEEHLLHLPHVVHLRQGASTLHDRLHLGEALRFREDRRVADGDDIKRPIKVCRLNLNASILRLNILLSQIGAVDAVQDLEAPRH